MIGQTASMIGIFNRYRRTKISTAMMIADANPSGSLREHDQTGQALGNGVMDVAGQTLSLAGADRLAVHRDKLARVARNC